MKKNFFFFSLCVLVICPSCSKSLFDGDKADENSTPTVDIAAIESLAEYQVPVQDGAVSIVKWGEDTLAVTQRPMPVLVSKDALSAGEITVTYEKLPQTKSIDFDKSASSQYWQYLSFEDTRDGDYDYNDVVLHCRIKSDAPWNYDGSQMCKHAVSVQPVALGGSKVLQLGIIYRPDPASEELAEKILCENIRQDLFLGDPTFPINTSLEKDTKKVTSYMTLLFEFQNKSSKFPVVWFIQSGTDRFYAATTNFGANEKFDMISKDGLPYGISMTKKWCYPIEKKHIKEAYPHFYEWVTQGKEEILLSDRVSANVFPATIKINGEDLWDWKP